MRDYYADSTVLTKCYVDERGTEFMLRLVADSSNWVFCSAVGEVEVVSALARRGYGDRLPSSVVETKVSEARADFDRKYHVVTITADLLSMACAVAQRRRLRGYDAVHLATALSISRAGRRLSRARTAPGACARRAPG